MRDFKRFVAFFIPAVIWGFFHHSGTELFSFLLNVASAIFGFFAASKWITSAQAGNIVIKEQVSAEEERRLLRTQAEYNSVAAFYAAFSAMLVALGQLVPVFELYFSMFTSQ